MANPIQLLLVENDLLIAQKMTNTLRAEGYAVTDVLRSREAVIQFFKASVEKKERLPEIVILDIELDEPGGTGFDKTGGIEAGKFIAAGFPEIILFFMTSYASDKELLAEAKLTNPVCFLSKPYKEHDLVNELELHYFQRTKGQTDGEKPNYSVLKDRLFIREDFKLHCVRNGDINYLKADRQYCHVFTSEREFYLTVSMAEVCRMLNSPSIQRVHRGYAVNLEKIKTIDGNRLFLHAVSTEIPIGKTYKKDFLDALTVL